MANHTTTNSPNAHHIPTHQDLAGLANAIANDGIVQNLEPLIDLAATVAKTNLFPGAVSVLQDSSSSEVTKARAFSVIARNWDEISAASRRHEFTQALTKLTTFWNRHQALRATRGVSIADLWSSRQKLDAARGDMSDARMAMDLQIL